MTNFRHSSENNVNTQLSRDEMLEISSEISDFFSLGMMLENLKTEPGFELSREELLEVSDKISLYFAPTRLSISQKLVILPIDPQHLYVYWELGNNQAPSLSQKFANNELSLKIYSQSNEDLSTVYQSTIHELQGANIIKLEVADKTSVYFASIGRDGLNNDFVPLIKSNKTYAFQGKQDNTVNTSGDYKSTQFIDLVRQKIFEEKPSSISCFANTNHSENGKKA